ncbi:MAG: hybrid sensor histidine kinase/response regulator [Gemmatimonadales bacterium]
MSSTATSDLSGFSMDDIFRQEVEEHVAVLTEGLLAVERGESAEGRLASMMRAAHSLKGAARVMGKESAVQVAHLLEDAFVAAQAGPRCLEPALVDTLLSGVDLLTKVSLSDAEGGPGSVEHGHEQAIGVFRSRLADPGKQGAAAATVVEARHAPAPPQPPPMRATEIRSSGDAPRERRDRERTTTADRATSPDQSGQATVRLSAEQLNRLLGLAGESVVASRWISAFGSELLILRRLQQEVARALDEVRTQAALDQASRTSAAVEVAATTLAACQHATAHSIDEFDGFDRRFLRMSHGLYEEVLSSRMQPFGDSTRGFSRMVRDLARELGKEVRLIVTGEATPVDRDVIRRLEAPLVHTLRNALDHGIETPEVRVAAGKPREGTLHLEASHRMGELIVSVTDDGRGIDPETIRRKAVANGLTTDEIADRFTEAELFEFLLLPGFTTAEAVTEISGRGVGLDVVQTVVREVGGRMTINSKPGAGTLIQLQLPLTLSLQRALVVRVAGEPYALPLTRVHRVLRVPRADVRSVEGRQHFRLDDRYVGLVSARNLLQLPDSGWSGPEFPVVVLGTPGEEYGVIVDALLGEEELVVRTLDPRLGKVANVSAAAVLPDGSPVLILDIDDVISSTEALAGGSRESLVNMAPPMEAGVRRVPRILVADDSITVRETERKLLQAAGYRVDVAVDGMEAWNALRAADYDLLVTDVDMPRLDGIELTKLVRADLQLRELPVMIVSYKDREEDRRRGLDAGADYYLTKASFHDDSLLRATATLLAGVRP